MAKRSNTWQKATALVPVALLSGAWTASLAASTATAAGESPGVLPDGTTLPTEAVEAPASVSNAGEIAPGVPTGSAQQVVSSASTNGIPAAALAAYQRATQVINEADPRCNLDWTLLAAIGRVESDHGRYGGNVLNAQGASEPGIYGIPLDGTNGTQKITDTDGGRFDQDPIYDRAVGPMQFIPSTWSVVGVDGDGDGKRDPQDIDDAALGAAVYLCSGKEDLSTRAGQEAAVFRYNHSQQYVDLVLSIRDAYASGEYTSVPTSSSASLVFGPAYDDSVFNIGTRGTRDGKAGGKQQPSGDGGSRSDDGHGDGSPKPKPTQPPPDGKDDPVSDVKDEPTKATDKVKDTVTAVEKATAYCQTQLTKAELTAIGGLSACVNAYLNGGASAVRALLDGLGDVVDDVVGGTLP